MEPSSFVVVANRLPVDEVVTPEGRYWRRSPGGLVTALQPVLASEAGTWVGWAGSATEAGDPGPQPFELEGMKLRPVPLTEDDVERYYEGFSNSSLWPLYHDAVETPVYKRSWWEAYRRVNQRFAEAAARAGGRGRDGVDPGLPAPARTGDAPGAAPRPADRVLPAHPVPAGRAVHAAAPAGRDPARAARRRPGRLPAPAGRPELPAADPPPARPASPGERGGAGRAHRPRGRLPDLDRRVGDREPGGQPAGPRPGRADPGGAGRPEDGHPRRRPARLHQGHRAAVQGVPRTAVRKPTRRSRGR